jgi:hypothetical protein
MQEGHTILKKPLKKVKKIYLYYRSACGTRTK